MSVPWAAQVFQKTLLSGHSLWATTAEFCEPLTVRAKDNEEATTIIRTVTLSPKSLREDAENCLLFGPVQLEVCQVCQESGSSFVQSLLQPHYNLPLDLTHSKLSHTRLPLQPFHLIEGLLALVPFLYFEYVEAITVSSAWNMPFAGGEGADFFLLTWNPEFPHFIHGASVLFRLWLLLEGLLIPCC